MEKVLRYIYRKGQEGNLVNLLDFYTANYPIESEEIYFNIKTTLTHLSDLGLIILRGDRMSQLGERKEHGTFTLKKWKEESSMTLMDGASYGTNPVGLFAKITIEGMKYIQQADLSKNVRITNNTSKIALIVTVILSAAAVSIQIITCRRDDTKSQENTNKSFQSPVPQMQPRPVEKIDTKTPLPVFPVPKDTAKK